MHQAGDYAAFNFQPLLLRHPVGPALGGWLTDNLSWHWIFLINGPIGLISLTLVQWMVHEPEVLERERQERFARGPRRPPASSSSRRQTDDDRTAGCRRSGRLARVPTARTTRTTRTKAFGLIEQSVLQQATLLSYIDVFAGLALIAAALVPIAFLLLRPAREAPVRNSNAIASFGTRVTR